MKKEVMQTVEDQKRIQDTIDRQYDRSLKLGAFVRRILDYVSGHLLSIGMIVGLGIVVGFVGFFRGVKK
jgi:hypothetical protein